MSSSSRSIRRRSSVVAEMSPASGTESPVEIRRSSSATRRNSRRNSTDSSGSFTPPSSPAAGASRRNTSKVRPSSSRGARSRAPTSSAARTRRPTPVAPRRNSNRLSEFIVDDGLADEQPIAEQQVSPVVSSPPRSRQVSFQASSSSGRNGTGGQSAQRASIMAASSSGRRSSRRGSTRQDGSLCWYERLMPECFLSITAPITGYENELEVELGHELNDEQLELLERNRFRRNRRIRRRLLAVVLVASLASAYFIYRGRSPSSGLFGMRRPPQGVRQTIGEMAHRFEEGLSKTIHDTMGK